MGNSARKRVTQKCVNQESQAAHTTLVIGNLNRWIAEGRAPLPCDDFQFTELDHLTPALIYEFAPTMVLSPLMGDNFDVVDVALRLNELEFDGQYRAITETLPDPEIICKEVRALAPKVDFDLLMMPPVANDV